MKKKILITFLIIVISFILFLSSNLAIFYYKNIRKNKNLIYDFEENTIQHEDIVFDSDISEQYLSYDISYGIDVSEWQGDIDWQKVKNTGICFAIIRCGFRETVGSNIRMDANFKKNIEGASEAGLKVGVYFFGAAKNKKEALEEAEFTINLIKDYNITYPVVYDLESFDEGRLKNIDYNTLTDNILTFTETVSSYGYETMVYSYKNAFTYKLYTGKLSGKLIWLAHYTSDTDYKGNFDMWQYTDRGHVDGIDSYVDLNISYFTYIEDETMVVFNPNYREAPQVEFTKTNDTVRTINTCYLRSDPTTDMPNKVEKLSRGIKLERTGISNTFSKVIYKGREYYIENKMIVETAT